MPFFECKDSIINTLDKLWHLLEIFSGLIKGFSSTWKPNPIAVESNIKFIQTYTNWIIKKVNIDAAWKSIDKSEVQSGDVILITRLDGLDPFIITATGSRVGHTTIVLRNPDDNDL